LSRRIGLEHREARVAAGLSQREEAKALGVSHSRIGRFERGELSDTSLELMTAACAVVGLDLSVRAYPAASRLRDRAQIALLDRLRQQLSPSLRWRTEVPLRIPGDLRAWDAEIAGAAWRLKVDAETALTDTQSLERRLALKARDDPDGHLLLLVADTRRNREAVPVLRTAMGGLLPLDPRAMLAALRDGRDPGGSGIVML
jgi:transcriptional regulator with XRE-family HTH domain